jgi:hypothetical protein
LGFNTPEVLFVKVSHIAKISFTLALYKP